MCTLAPSIKEANFWKKNMPYALCLREISVDFIMFEDVASYNVMDWGYMFINCQLWKKKNILGHIRKLNRQNLFRQKNGHSKVLKVPQFFPPFWEDANNLWIKSRDILHCIQCPIIHDFLHHSFPHLNKEMFKINPIFNSKGIKKLGAQPASALSV